MTDKLSNIQAIDQANNPDFSQVDSSKPYYMENNHDIEELESQMSILNPRQRERYGKIEDVVSSQFVQIYGKFLNEEQLQYFSSREIIYTSYDLADKFGEDWDANIESIDPDISEIDGNIYLAYSVGKPVEEVFTSLTNSGSTPRHYWAGRIVIHPLGDDEISEVDEKWLMSEKAFDEWGDIRHETKEEYDERWASIYPYVYTNSVGSVAVHEKVHGIQDPQLPLPVLEAAAYYYQMQVAQNFNWTSSIDDNMSQFAKLYQEFVDEIGDDAHLLLFGNIEDPTKKDSLIKKVKQKFNTEAIDKASKYQENERWEEPRKKIFWKTMLKEQVEREEQI